MPTKVGSQKQKRAGTQAGSGRTNSRGAEQSEPTMDTANRVQELAGHNPNVTGEGETSRHHSEGITSSEHEAQDRDREAGAPSKSDY